MKLPVHENRARIGLSAVLLVLCVGLIGFLGAELKAKQMDVVLAEQKRDYALRKAQLIIESSPWALIVCDEDGIIRECNAAAEKMLGWSHSEAVGQSSAVLVPEELRLAHSEGIRKAKENLEKYDGDWLLTSNRRLLKALKKDGTTMDAIATVRAIKYGSDIDFILSLSPATPPLSDGPLMLQKQEKLSDVEAELNKKLPDYAQIARQSAD